MQWSASQGSAIYVKRFVSSLLVVFVGVHLRTPHDRLASLHGSKRLWIAL